MKQEINRHEVLEKITPLIENTAMRFGYIPICKRKSQMVFAYLPVFKRKRGYS